MSKIQGRTAAPGKGKEDLLRLLEEAQSKSGYLSEEVITELAQSVAMSVSDVYGVATFYSFLSTKPLGRNVVRICRSLPCHLKDSGMIIKSIEDELGIKPGETTPDGKFSLELTNCIGACDEAPAVLINNDVHGNLTPKKIIAILKSYK
ncbi:MAG: NADH-quinone oxidoreductase subunit NuoE [Chloroflexi bacterium]|nr:NADH-quinone oxidoreductase subunit NuoE [Chloroflexota bacterium]